MRAWDDWQLVMLRERWHLDDAQELAAYCRRMAEAKRGRHDRRCERCRSDA